MHVKILTSCLIYMVGVQALIPTHNFYLSINEFRYHEQEDILEVNYKMFTDDLEEAIRNMTGEGPLLRDSKALSTHGSVIEKYIKGKTKLWIAGKELAMVFVRAENQNDTVVVYFRIEGVEQLRKVEIQNNILTEVFDTQVNVVRFFKGPKAQYLQLNKKNPSGTLSF